MKVHEEKLKLCNGVYLLLNDLHQKVRISTF